MIGIRIGFSRLLLVTSVAMGFACVSARVPALTSTPATVNRENLAFRPTRAFYRNEGLAGIARELNRAATGVRVLHVAAHPDDEDSALVAYLSLGAGVRVTYLSLTRGEGGQNLIGDEFFEDLGVLRTSELLAAREKDGADQLFGRMIDFGYSKTADEAFRHWPKEEIVRDIVRAIRKTRPHIVTCRFSGTPRDGHGQHLVSVFAAREAIRVSGISESGNDLFLELTAQGLPPWDIQKFYSGILSRGEPPAGAFKVETNQYDPWSGRSYGSIGYEGRSQHRSQDMGMIEYEDSRPSRLRIEMPIKSISPQDRSLFTELRIPHSLLRDRTRDVLNRIGDLNASNELASSIAGLLDRWRAEAPEEVETVAGLERALAAALGLRLEAFAASAVLIPGASGEIECRAYLKRGVELRNAKWTLESGADFSFSDSDSPPAIQYSANFKIEASESAPLSLPYYMRGNPADDLYPWPEEAFAGDPFAAPPFVARFSGEYGGTAFALRVPVEYRMADPAYGEIRADLAVVPRVSVRFEPGTLAIPLDFKESPVEISVVIHNWSAEAFEGRLDIFARAGAKAATAAVAGAVGSGTEAEAEPIESLEVTLAASETATIRLLVDPARIDTDGGVLEVSARWAADAVHPSEAATVDHLDYRHIRSRYLSRPASLKLSLLDVRLPEGLRVGYIEGSGDDGASVLAQIGARVEMLDPAQLAHADLEGFDAIVTGVRAYEVNDALVENNERLLDYVRGGGTLVVQYNKYAFAGKNVAPFPMTYARPHDRVTDEGSLVNVLEPRHPIFNYPNTITDADFEGWVQDRGLYFWSSWASEYTPLLESSDPGEEPKQGGMMVATMGEGHYVYTGYAFFRQFPGKVEGAIRLFANLVSLGRARRGDAALEQGRAPVRSGIEN